MYYTVWTLGALLFVALMWLNFHSQRPSLRVLMYHKVSDAIADPLTVTTGQLRQHLQHLQQSNYQFVSLSAVLSALPSANAQLLPRRSVLVTFDDAYQNNLTYALPILREFAVPATIFVSTAYVGGVNEWDEGSEGIMTSEQLRYMVGNGLTLGYHSHRHLNFKNVSPKMAKTDLIANIQAAADLNLPTAPALSFAYGGRPKDPVARQNLVNTIERLGIRAAFRIGNRINPLPLRDPYDLNRIDVRGTDSLATFRRKVKWGKLL